jgi:hypothetical protein
MYAQVDFCGDSNFHCQHLWRSSGCGTKPAGSGGSCRCFKQYHFGKFANEHRKHAFDHRTGNTLI